MVQSRGGGIREADDDDLRSADTTSAGCDDVQI